MYGFVNRAIELMVLRKFGQETWEQIKREAGIELPAHFLVRVTYPDNITYALVGAAEKVLKVPAAAILELFGAFFYEFCVESGYDRILQVLGSTTADFLNNLDALHDHLATIYPGMRAPSFRCTNVEDGVILHYYSERPGLEPIVVGLVKTVAKELHGSTVRVTVKREKQAVGDDVQFLIQEEKPTHVAGETISGNAEPPALYLPITEALGPNAQLNTFNSHEMLAARASNASAHGGPDVGGGANKIKDAHTLISPETFSTLFPFHIMFGANLQTIQAGAAVCRLLPQLTSPHCYIDTVFELVRPRLDFTFASLLSHINTITILETKPGLLGYAIHNDGHARHLRLKGQMLHLAEYDALVFVASPSVTSLDDMVAHNIKLSDVPVHDATRDLVLLSEHWSHEYKLAQNLEYFIDKLQQTYRALDEEKLKTDNLLYSVLPPSVATRLKQNQPVPAERHRAVTLMFTGIVGFNEYCRVHGGSRGAMTIVKTLNMVFSSIDALVDLSGMKKVYKVETVQDHYVAVSGLPEACDDHAQAVAELALNLMDAAKEFYDDEGNPIRINIGLHSGEVVTGVIGNKAPRYCLFGNVVNIASRTLTCGLDEQINVSETTYHFLSNENNEKNHGKFQLEFRGEVEMKGRPVPMKCYILRRAPAPPPAPSATVEVVEEPSSPPPLLVATPAPAVAAAADSSSSSSNNIILPVVENNKNEELIINNVSPLSTPSSTETSPDNNLSRRRAQQQQQPQRPAATTVHKTSRTEANHQIARADVVVQRQSALRAVPIAAPPLPPARPTQTPAAPTVEKVTTASATAAPTRKPSTTTATTATVPDDDTTANKDWRGKASQALAEASAAAAATAPKQTTRTAQQNHHDHHSAANPAATESSITANKIMGNRNGPVTSAAAANQLPSVLKATSTTTTTFTHSNNNNNNVNSSNSTSPTPYTLTRHQYYSPELYHRRMHTPMMTTAVGATMPPIQSAVVLASSTEALAVASRHHHHHHREHQHQPQHQPQHHPALQPQHQHQPPAQPQPQPQHQHHNHHRRGHERQRHSQSAVIDVGGAGGAGSRFHTHDNNYYLPSLDEQQQKQSTSSTNDIRQINNNNNVVMKTTTTARPPPRDNPSANNNNNNYSDDGEQQRRQQRHFMCVPIQPPPPALVSLHPQQQQQQQQMAPVTAVVNSTPLHVTRAVQIISYTPTFVNPAVVQHDTEQVHPQTKGRPRWRLYKVTRV